MTRMLFLASIVLFILKVTAFTLLSWWIIVAPILLALGIWAFTIVATFVVAWKLLD